MTAAYRVLVLLLALALAACVTHQVQTAPGTPLPRAERPTYQLGEPTYQLGEKWILAERPTYSLGEKWILNDGIYELIRIENDRYIFSAGPAQEIHLTKDLVIARVQKAQQVIMAFDPPPTLPWPLEVGKSGMSAGKWYSKIHPEGVEARLDWSVDAYEEVTLPVAPFRLSESPTS